MIINKEELFERIENYQFEKDTGFNYPKKINRLEKAIDNSIREICEEVLKTDKEVNLSYSGGVDSSLILVKLLSLFPEENINAVTIAKREDYPDVKYSEEFVKKIQREGRKIKHNVHLTEISPQDIKESNNILGKKGEKVDNYYMLMKILSNQDVKKVVGGDVIDELMGGYYAHSKNPRLTTFEEFMSKLIPNHLEILDKMSTHFGIEVFLPYGSKEVMYCASKFFLGELVKRDKRKRLIYEIARKNNVSQEIIERRKYGLVSAFD